MRRLVAPSRAAPTLYITHANTPTDTRRLQTGHMCSAALDVNYSSPCCSFLRAGSLISRSSCASWCFSREEPEETTKLFSTPLRPDLPQFGPQVQHGFGLQVLDLFTDGASFPVRYFFLLFDIGSASCSPFLHIFSRNVSIVSMSMNSSIGLEPLQLTCFAAHAPVSP